jgi:hypothetical protein
MAVPVEYARRARVVIIGEAFSVVLVEAGDGGVSICPWDSRSMLGLNIRGKERRFSSTVEAGDGERVPSRVDIEQVRWVDRRTEVLRVSGGIVAGLEPSEANSLEATQTPDTIIRLRNASFVSMGSLPARASAKDSESMLGGVVGDCVYEGTLGVGGEVADGIV